MRESDDARQGVSTSRRRLLAAAGTATAGLVAGCSGGGSDDEDDDGDDGSTTDGGGASVTGTLESEVDELELVSGEYTDTGIEGRFPVTVTVKNNGNQETDVMEYSYEYAVFDGDGNDVTGGTSSTAENPTTAPGETKDVLVTVIVDGADPEDVASYEVTLSCASTFDEGVYCEGSSA